MAQQTPAPFDMANQTSSGGVETLALIAVLTGISTTVALLEFGHLRIDSPWMCAVPFLSFGIFVMALAASRLQRFSAMSRKRGGNVR